MDDETRRQLSRFPGVVEHAANLEAVKKGELPTPRAGETQDAANARYLEYLSSTHGELPPAGTLFRKVLNEIAAAYLRDIRARGLHHRLIFAAADEIMNQPPDIERWARESILVVDPPEPDIDGQHRLNPLKGR